MPPQPFPLRSCAGNLPGNVECELWPLMTTVICVTISCYTDSLGLQWGGSWVLPVSLLTNTHSHAQACLKQLSKQFFSLNSHQKVLCLVLCTVLDTKLPILFPLTSAPNTTELLIGIFNSGFCRKHGSPSAIFYVSIF